jgi:hypothetical protein
LLDASRQADLDKVWRQLLDEAGRDGAYGAGSTDPASEEPEQPEPGQEHAPPATEATGGEGEEQALEVGSPPPARRSPAAAEAPASTGPAPVTSEGQQPEQAMDGLVTSATEPLVQGAGGIGQAPPMPRVSDPPEQDVIGGGTGFPPEQPDGEPGRQQGIWSLETVEPGFDVPMITTPPIEIPGPAGFPVPGIGWPDPPIRLPGGEHPPLGGGLGPGWDPGAGVGGILERPDLPFGDPGGLPVHTLPDDLPDRTDGGPIPVPDCPSCSLAA